MAELRRELTCDVREVSRGAREMANPMHYIRRYPWATAAVAAGIGYFLVPKKKQVIKPDPEMLAELIRKHQVKIGTTGEATATASESQSMLKSLAVMGLTWALRTGLSYAGQRLASAAMQSPQAPHSPPDSSTEACTEETSNNSG